ncbi:MAG TPA: glycosyltransferase family 39 protein [Candidatus Angelobacter sp.]|nr:glycosyltransferase family 39 protein [Candidatus Angelobacter sp.]
MMLRTDDDRRATWLLLALTAAIFIGSAGIPALLDDADSFYAVVAREMNLRHDWITPYANSIRYLEKPPLFYWLIALSYKMFGTTNAFTARLPTALAVMALVFVTSRIGGLLFGMRAGLFAGLALATSIGMFLFTRIILPDALFTLILALLVYSFLRWERDQPSTWPLLMIYLFCGFAVLAKGLIGIVFPAGIILGTLLLTGRVKETGRLLSVKGILLFLVIALPWHLAVGSQNPGFYWFYFINEHLLRFLGKRYPKDYGTVPLLWFWLLHLVWLFPWSIYLMTLLRPANFKRALEKYGRNLVLPIVWALTILLFFSFSSRLEYYTVPAFPALALLAGSQCAAFWEGNRRGPGVALAAAGVLMGIALIVIAVTITAGAPDSWFKLKDNPDLYVYYLGHLFDLTPESLTALRMPMILAAAGLGMLIPLHLFLKRPESKAASLALGMAVFFLAADIAFMTFAPRLTSRPVADEISRRLTAQSDIVIDGEWSEGSSVAFYTGRVLWLHNGRKTTLEYGSRYPDAPPLFPDDEAVRRMWNDEGRRVFLVTFASKLAKLDALIPEDKYLLFRYGDKILFSNRPDR